MKRKWQPLCVCFLQILALLILAANLSQAQVRVVNIIPNSRSGETNQDSEPNLAVNPADPSRIVATAFTPDPMGGANAPIYFSLDGGNTWFLNSIVPGNGMFGTGDITVRFGGSSNILYAGILRGDAKLRMNILRTSDFTSPAVMEILRDRLNVDQPFIQATTVTSGPDIGKDRVYVGNNNTVGGSMVGPRTATIDRSLDAATAAPPAGLVALLISTRNGAVVPKGRQDGPPIRVAIHPNGTIYAVYFGWRTFGATITTDVVVVRDDNWGAGATPFSALSDLPMPPGDGIVGKRVVTGIMMPWVSPTLGQERVGADLSIAVDPTNSSTVYIAWADGTSTYTLHVRRSIDAGMTWSGDLRTISNAKNPSLAFNDQGKLGFLYQQVTGTGGGQRWVTHLERTTDGFATSPTDLVLANVPANAPAPTFLPYIGDYSHLMSAGKDFYGIFSANNTPDPTNFPSGVTYQRNANLSATTPMLLDLDNTTPVPVSIDPFFFMVTEPLADCAIMKSDSPDPVITGSNITYTLTVKNNGPTDASSVTVTDNLPGVTSFVSCSVSGVAGGTCSGGSSNNRTISFPSFPVNATATITLTAQVNCPVADGVMISNTATVSSTTPDPNLANNTAMTTTLASNPAPVITCPANVTVGNNPGQCFATLSPGMATATDNCPGVVVTGARSDGRPLTDSYPVGVTTITWTATDSGGRKASCVQSIKVNDVEPPKIICPADQIAATPKPGDVSVIVNYPAPSVTDNCPGATVVCSPPSGAAFPIGVTTVNCTATDNSGNKASCNFKVTVFDVCIQDDGSRDFLLFNSFTGDYLFKHCGPDQFTMVGKGKIIRVGCSIKLEDDTRVVIGEAIRCPSTFTGNTGSARIKRTPLGPTFVLEDSYILNNTCACP